MTFTEINSLLFEIIPIILSIISIILCVKTNNRLSRIDEATCALYDSLKKEIDELEVKLLTKKKEKILQ